MKVLVVDDVGMIRHLIAILLKKLGHESVGAASGPEGLSLLRRDSTINVVLFDLLMPGTLGLDYTSIGIYIDLERDDACSVGEPMWQAFFSRSSSGSMPSFLARMSSVLSAAKAEIGEPGARYAAAFGRLLTTS